MWVMQSLPQKFFCAGAENFCDELCAGAGRGELRLPSIGGGVLSLCSFVPLFAPAGPSAHAPAVSLSVHKTFAIPVGVAVFHYNQLPTKNSSLIKSIKKTGVEKDSFFYTYFNLWAYWTDPFSLKTEYK
ncbi:hypothetical protein MHH81_16040 [Psychrobacillus sp. FSL H8-0484]|uniref:hypothetical protein n=1 Tax=Psychrobacillus sp. FSL H8-0484 TaxID=2921390 RepID=UPI0030F8EEAC